MPKDFLSGGFQNNSGKSRNFYKLSVPAFRGNFPHKFSGIFLERKIRFFPIFFSDCSCNENLWVFFGKKFPRKTIHRLYPHSFSRPLSLLTKPHTTIWDHFIASNIHGHVAADGRKPSSAYVPNLKAFAPGEVRCRFAPLAPRKAEEIETKVRYAPHPQRLPSIFHPKFRGANLDPPDKVITLQRIPALISQLEVSCIG